MPTQSPWISHDEIISQPRELLSGDAVQRRTGALFHRRLVGLIVGLVDHDRFEDHLFWDLLLAQMAKCDLGGEAALDISIVVAAGENLARTRQTTETRGQIERGTAVASGNGYCLARVQ